MTKKQLVHILGPRAAIDMVTPTGVDAAKVFEFTVLRSSQNPQQILSEAAATVGQMNENLVAEYGSLFYVTESMYSFTRQGEATRQSSPERAEFTNADAKISSLIGSMLPYKKINDALGWSQDYLVDAFPAQLVADVQFLGERWRNKFEFDMFKRMLTNTENALGSGYDVPWAIGTGTTVDYIPPQAGAKLFDANHTHFIALDTDTPSTFVTLIEAQVSALREHRIRGRVALLISEDDATTVMALTRFSEFIPQVINVVGGNTSSPVNFALGEYEGIPGDLMGYYRSTKGLVEVRTHPRMPQGYTFLTRPYGINNPQNGLALRVHPSRGFGMSFEPDIRRIYNPRLEKVDCEAWYGFGINDRLNGVAGLLKSSVTAGTWVNPSDSDLGG